MSCGALVFVSTLYWIQRLWAALFGETGVTIIFYEDRNFQGRYHESGNDFSDLHTYVSRCNSIKVLGGFWVVYEKPNYMGHQYVLSPGEYPDYQYWLGINDAVRSCRVVRHVNFSGQMMEFSEDLSDLQDRWRQQEVHSAHVQDGLWIFYENPSYRGRQYLLEKGEYRRHSEWGALHPAVGSIRQTD
uniref:Beta/gamma crystallin 'Greek key' domain-containing protein n=1 Tax=Poecilia mexicana TaxID=48701 RepID=A0A3B3Z2R6_9TELE